MEALACSLSETLLGSPTLRTYRVRDSHERMRRSKPGPGEKPEHVFWWKPRGEIHCEGGTKLSRGGIK
jgi:hypothetical protein